MRFMGTRVVRRQLSIAFFTSTTIGDRHEKQTADFVVCQCSRFFVSDFEKFRCSHVTRWTMCVLTS